MEQEYRSKEDSKYLTGFHDMDKLTAGLHPEELTIIAARPGVGKTAFALNLISNMAAKGIKSVFISREMSQIQLTKRLIANITPIDGNKLRICKLLTDEDWAKIGDAAGEIGDWDLIINDELATVQEIRTYCRELKNKGKLDMLVVDYLQLCRSSGKHESRRQEIEEISRQFKEMSMEFEVPVIVLSQLSRDNAKNGRVPELHDLRESGSIEQDADNVIFLHVPKDTDQTQDIFDLQVIIGKQRNGPTGYIFLKYFKKTFKLCNIERQKQRQ
jgi:replicative DNA helicase